MKINLKVAKPMFMKFYFSFFFIFFFVSEVSPKETAYQYLVKTRGLTIGELTWSVFLDEEEYKIDIDLKSKGIVSKLYSFEGSYLSSGNILKKKLIPKKYNQIWITKKKRREVKIEFDDLKITKLINLPKEKEMLRVSLEELGKYKDPLTSFLSILLYRSPSLTIDGRRAYLLRPKKNQNIIKIFVGEYRNLWADHKRNKLGYIEVFEDNKSILPKKINIKFGGSLFSIIKN